jgi:hypothetical protein
MEAHEAFERFERNFMEHGALELARNAAVAVAVLAGFLAVSTFLSNESIKEAINGETRSAQHASLLASNETQLHQAENNTVLLRAVGAGGPSQARAAAHARVVELRIEQHLRPEDARLRKQIKVEEDDRDHANDDHLIYELSQVGLQLGIVLASVSIIARKRWLLIGGCGCGVVGAILLALGLLN